MASTINKQFTIGDCHIPAQRIPAGLSLVATPIGNLGDISLRALHTLAGADLILCEDTRNTSRLLRHFQITTGMKPYHDHNAARVRPAIMAQLEAGKAIALVSDAGTPLVSDPGYKLVRACIDAGVQVHMVPGASAPVMALALSGLASDQFQFCGFLPAKSSARQRLLGAMKETEATLVFFDTAPRIEASLDDVMSVFGDRQIAVARELTKLHEEVLRGPASEVVADIRQRGGLKGEITLVVAGGTKDAQSVDEPAVREALAEALAAMPAGQASAQVARRFGVSRKEVYELALRMKSGSSG
jgi:16S rRNA (cytidine1402-2'-O)-methyltransferase